MAPRSPYVVRLVTPDESIAVKLRELPKFSRTWRGGFKEASIRLATPLDSNSTLLQPFSKMRIEDRRTGRIVSETYLDLPGKTRTRADGDIWEIGGVGPSARLADRARGRVWVDRTFEGWEFLFATRTGKMSAGPGALPAGAEEGTDCLLLSWQNGLAVDNADRVTMDYNRLWQVGQNLGGVQIRHREGFASTTQRTRVIAATHGGTEDISNDLPWVTSLTTSSMASAGGTQFGTGRDRLKLQIYRDGGSAQNTNSENWWSGVTDIWVIGRRRDINGDVISGEGSYVAYVLAHEVVIDSLYWFCAQINGSDWFTAIDIPNAQIDTSFSYQIDQLTYIDPTNMQQVLEDLALLEPDMAWEVLESNSNNQHRFILHRVPDGSMTAGSAQTGPRYIATTEDGWNEPGGEADMRNTVTVDWEDGTGRKQTKTYAASDFGLSVPGLDQWSILRDAPAVHLNNELGSQANADRIAQKILEQAASPPRSGTLTVRGKIHDAWSGMDVWPWEIETGYPLLIQDIDLDPLPITDVDVDGTVGTLTLAEPVLTDEQIINQLSRRRRRRG